MSYPVSGLGKPQGGGAFPLWEDVDFLGGFQVQPTTTARDAIPLLNQKVGMWCWVTAGGGTLYQLTATGTPGTWAAVSFGASAPGGTGPVKASGGAFSVGAIDLASSEVTGTLPASKQASQGLFGDVTGTTGASVVVKVNGVSVGIAPTAAGQVLTSVSTSSATWQTAPSSFAAGGDLGGSPTSQTVNKIQGVAISGTPAAGYAIVATSGTAAAWTAPPTGTGVIHYVGGVRAATAALVDLTADVSGVLPPLQGGGQVLWPTQSTNTGTPILLATSPVIATGAAISCFGHVLFDDNGTSAYDAVAQGVWRNNAGSVVGVYTPTPPSGNGALLGCAISFVINNTTKRIEMYGTLSGTAIGTTIFMTPELTYTTR